MMLMLCAFLFVVDTLENHPSNNYYKFDYTEDGLMIGFDTSYNEHFKSGFFFFYESQFLYDQLHSPDCKKKREVRRPDAGFEFPVVVSFSTGNYSVKRTDCNIESFLFNSSFNCSDYLNNGSDDKSLTFFNAKKIGQPLYFGNLRMCSIVDLNECGPYFQSVKNVFELLFKVTLEEESFELVVLEIYILNRSFMNMITFSNIFKDNSMENKIQWANEIVNRVIFF